MLQRRFDNIVTYLRAFGSPTRPASPSTPRFSGSSTPLVVFTARRTSSPPSTSTVAGSISYLNPLTSRDALKKRKLEVGSRKVFKDIAVPNTEEHLRSSCTR